MNEARQARKESFPASVCVGLSNTRHNYLSCASTPAARRFVCDNGEVPQALSSDFRRRQSSSAIYFRFPRPQWRWNIRSHRVSNKQGLVWKWRL